MKGKTDWKRVRAMRDADIAYDDDAPMISDSDFKLFKRPGRPKSAETLQGVYLRLPRDTVEKLRSHGRGWQSILREKIREMIRLGMF
jgi:uncharacterized protein (DUF4415 family)